MRKLWDFLRSRQALSYLLIVLCGIAFYMLLQHFSVFRAVMREILSMLSPLLIGAAIAYLLSPIVHLFANHVLGRMKHRRPAHAISVVITLLLAFGLVVLIIVAIIPQLMSSVTTLLQNLDDYFEGAKTTLKDWASRIPLLSPDIDGLLGTSGEMLQSFVDWISLNWQSILGGAVQASSTVLDILLAVVLSAYVLFDERRIVSAFTRWGKSVIKTEKHARTGQVISRCNHIFMKYVGGNLLDALIIGVANFLFLIILRIPYPLLIATIAALTNLIPTFGPIIGAIPNLLIILIVNPVNTLWFLLFTVVTQLLDGTLIKPLLFGDSTGLSPLWALIAIIVCGRLFGVLGMLFGVPVFAIISTLMEDATAKRLRLRGLDTNGDPVTPNDAPAAMQHDASDPE